MLSNFSSSCGQELVIHIFFIKQKSQQHILSTYTTAKKLSLFMPAASSLLPWFAPRLSRPMMGVLNNLGHEMHYTRGEVLYESPGFFRPLMLVRRGIVARALMDPLHADPLLVSLSGPRALCGSCETLYVQDRMVRRHWCMTSVDVHVVNADLLLRICDQNPL